MDMNSKDYLFSPGNYPPVSNSIKSVGVVVMGRNPRGQEDKI